MKKSQLAFAIKGMNRDLGISKMNTEFSYENRNLRIDLDEESNLLVLHNESSTEEILSGKFTNVIGYAILNNYCVVFDKSDKDKIHLLTINGSSVDYEMLFSGNLNLPDDDSVFEAISDYETENLQKVYWIDGINPLRVLNIKELEKNPLINYEGDPFSSVSNLSLSEDIKIEKVYNGEGLFPSGVIQYAFTYFDTFGKESPIVYLSPLMYLTHKDRGASPEDKVTSSFEVRINGLQSTFDKLAIYSIQRTSLEATPLVYKVSEVPIKGKSSISILDRNRDLESIDPTSLLYLGSDSLIPYTFTVKDGTMFFGNYRNDRDGYIHADKLYDSITDLKTRVDKNGDKVLIKVDDSSIRNYFDFNLDRGEDEIKHFKKGDSYNLGVVFQHKNGKYSQPVFLENHLMSISPDFSDVEESGKYSPNSISIALSEELINDATSKGYIKAIPVIEYPSKGSSFLAQGVLNPTVFNLGNRYNNAPYAQSSWFFRPNPPTSGGDDYIAYRHMEMTHHNGKCSGELIIDDAPIDSAVNTSLYPLNGQKHRHAVDRSILTMYSPDINDETFVSPYNLRLDIVGIIPIHNANSRYKITTSSAPRENSEHSIPSGFVPENGFHDGGIFSNKAYKTLCASPVWSEYFNDEDNFQTKYLVYPFHNTGGIGKDKGGENRAGVLKTKNLYNYKFSKYSVFGNLGSLRISDATLIPDDSDKLYQIKKDGKSIFYKNYLDYILYSGDAGGYYSAGTIRDGGIFNDKARKYTEPVSIKYKSSDHALISLNNSVLPYVNPESLSVQTDSIHEDIRSFSFDRVDRVGKTITLRITSQSIKPYLNTSRVAEEFLGSVSNLFEVMYRGSSSEVLSYSNGDPRTITYKITLKDGTPEGLEESRIRQMVNYSLSSYIYEDMSTSDINDRLIESNIHVENKWYDYDYLGPKGVAIGKKTYAGHIKADIVVEIPLEPKSIPGDLLSKISLGRSYQISQSGSNTKIVIKHEVHNVGRDMDRWNNEYDWDAQVQMIRNILSSYSSNPFDDTVYEGYFRDVYSTISSFGFMLLGELYRVSPSFNKDLTQIRWSIGGDGTLISKSRDIVYTIGDTYYQRYNAVGSLPISIEDENQIVDVLSFMVETKTNLNGIYDRNRTNVDFSNITDKNYNKVNPVYAQSNNFIGMRYLDEEVFKNNDFKNKITWSKQKYPGANLDPWLHMNGINSTDCLGDKGQINKLIRYNDQIYCFQDNAISVIPFNARVQVPVSDGVPIEITNGYKVDSPKYMSEFIGAKYKKTVCSTRTGVFFVDSNSNASYILGGEMKAISDTYGFKNYIKSLDHPNIRVFYDDRRGDVYMRDKDTLSYSIRLENYETFLDYSSQVGMFNIDNNFYSISKNKVWIHNSSESRCNLYGVTYPFSIEYRVNPQSNKDKTFTNIQLRGDSRDIHTGDIKRSIDLDRLDAKTEYQEGSINELFKYTEASSLKGRARYWRANMPRQKGTLNRLQDQWCSIKLTSKETNDKTEIHDLVITYYE